MEWVLEVLENAGPTTSKKGRVFELLLGMLYWHNGHGVVVTGARWDEGLM